jgi:hypothetical protein
MPIMCPLGTVYLCRSLHFEAAATASTSFKDESAYYDRQDVHRLAEEEDAKRVPVTEDAHLRPGRKTEEKALSPSQDIYKVLSPHGPCGKVVNSTDWEGSLSLFLFPLFLSLLFSLSLSLTE